MIKLDSCTHNTCKPLQGIYIIHTRLLAKYSPNKRNLSHKHNGNHVTAVLPASRYTNTYIIHLTVS